MTDQLLKAGKWTGATSGVLLLGCLVGYLLFGWGLNDSNEQASYRLLDARESVGDQSFNQPFAITIDPNSGQVLVTDAGNQRVVILNRDGEFIRQFGKKGDGPGAFQRPTGLAVGSDGHIYVADYMQDRIQEFTADGVFVRQWGETGSGNHQFHSPNGLAVNEQGQVFVADFGNNVVKAFTSEGQFVRTVGQPGQWQRGDLDYPTDVDIGPNGEIFVADAYNYRVQRYTSSGEPRAAWGWHLFWIWPRPNSRTKGFNIPTGVDVGPEGGIHVADSANNRIVMLDRRGDFVTDWHVPNPGSGFHSPNMLAVGPNGERVYATDIANNRVIVLELRTSG